MKSNEILALAAVVVLFFYWRSRPSTAANGRINLNTGRAAGKGGLTPSTLGSTASTTPRLGRRQTIGLINAAAGAGKGFITAPVKSISRLNNPTRQNIGTATRRGQLSRAWSGTGTAGISPAWPTRAFKSNGQSIKTGNGFVQVPSYAAVPTVTRGPGGVGSTVFLGGRS